MKFYSNGKLLLTAEYFILDGAEALCLPTKKGQSLEIQEEKNNTINTEIHWIAKDYNDLIWFQTKLDLTSKSIIQTNNPELSKILLKIFTTKETQKHTFKTQTIYHCTTKLDFPRNWGLGTSSTLIYNLSQWLQINPYILLNQTFGGSGYDLACAKHNQPILYQLQNKEPKTQPISYQPKFQENLYFVYLNQKQNSREGIQQYRSKPTNQNYINQITQITQQITQTTDIQTFQNLLNQHEIIVSKHLEIPTAKQTHFSDFIGSIKSLGAWGGDFILATSTTNPTSYFQQKGYTEIIPYSEMIL